MNRAQRKRQPWGRWGLRLERICARSECPRQFDDETAMRLHQQGLSVIEAIGRLPFKTWAASMLKNGRAPFGTEQGDPKP
jgi:hypothetical protein